MTAISAAQTPQVPETPEPTIEVSNAKATDQKIEARIIGILAEIEPLTEIEVNVTQGVVTLSGKTANEIQAQQAVRLARRLEGVVTVEDKIERTLDVAANVKPVMEQLKVNSLRVMNALPLTGLAIIITGLFSMLGLFLSRRRKLWTKLAPNTFVAEVLGPAVFLLFTIFGLVLALNLLGAYTLIAAVLGGAGVVGLGIGFSIRDYIENYFASVMLSLRQPFRANDQVLINNQEGIVVRLTSRATILMTLDGNHLRIPNASVFKGTILNYTTNPERRFSFDLGIDSADNPMAAIQVGIDAMRANKFVLSTPEPDAIISNVGDSNIIITFMAWINQNQTNYGKARSVVIFSVMKALEENGFSIPEPIYRLRFDGKDNDQDILSQPHPPKKISSKDKSADPTEKILIQKDTLDVSPDRHLEEKINKERSDAGESDLLDQERPKE